MSECFIEENFDSEQVKDQLIGLGAVSLPLLHESTRRKIVSMASEIMFDKYWGRWPSF